MKNKNNCKLSDEELIKLNIFIDYLLSLSLCKTNENLLSYIILSDELSCVLFSMRGKDYL